VPKRELRSSEKGDRFIFNKKSFYTDPKYSYLNLPITKTDDKIEGLLAKHPSLTKPEAIKIVTDKNARKKKNRVEKAERSKAQKPKNEANPSAWDEVDC
jgi:hypothetical protein